MPKSNPYVTLSADVTPAVRTLAEVLENVPYLAQGGIPIKDGSVPSDGRAELDLFVPGTPKPKGSKDYKGKRRNGSAILVESADVAPWQSEVARVARASGVTITGPVAAAADFILRRPKKIKDGMTGLGRNVGDGDKLTRAVWDALTDAGVIEDDSRVLSWSGSKRLADPGEPTGVRVRVRSWRP